MEWHFGEKTGSDFWLGQMSSLPFDPRRDIRTVADLARFPDVSPRWRSVPIEDLVPQGCREVAVAPKVWESGATTGEPKRVIEVGNDLQDNANRWCSGMLERHGFPSAGNWLYLGPGGPHFVAQDIRTYARLRRGSVFSIDLDPRWVKKCIREGHTEVAGRYVDHVLEQAEWILRSQRVTAMMCTPPLLEVIADRPAVAELIRSQIRGIVWGGASMSRETRHLLRTEVFPDITLVGVYGNTLMGRAPERAGPQGDPADCVFQPYHPFVHLSVIDPETGRDVGYGERGQVRMHRLDRDVFLPNVIERDHATRVAPTAEFPGDGVANVAPIDVVGGTKVIEGVY